MLIVGKRGPLHANSISMLIGKPENSEKRHVSWCAWLIDNAHIVRVYRRSSNKSAIQSIETHMQILNGHIRTKTMHHMAETLGARTQNSAALDATTNIHFRILFRSIAAAFNPWLWHFVFLCVQFLSLRFVYPLDLLSPERNAKPETGTNIHTHKARCMHVWTCARNARQSCDRSTQSSWLCVQQR